MRREQKTAKAGYPCEGMLETESSKGLRSIVPLESAEEDGAEEQTNTSYLSDTMTHYPTDTRYCTQVIEPPRTERYAWW